MNFPNLMYKYTSVSFLCIFVRTRIYKNTILFLWILVHSRMYKNHQWLSWVLSESGSFLGSKRKVNRVLEFTRRQLIYKYVCDSLKYCQQNTVIWVMIGRWDMFEQRGVSNEICFDNDEWLMRYVTLLITDGKVCNLMNGVND